MKHEFLNKESAFLGLLLLVSVVLRGCADRNSTAVEEDTLARINDFRVSVAQFETTFKEYYYRTGQVLSPDSQTRKAILENEFNTYILATYAIQEGLSSTPEARAIEQAVRRRVLTDEYNKQVINQDISVTEEDLRDYFLRFNTRIRASHLYATSLDEILALQKRLQGGESFEQVAKETFKHPELAKNGGDLGWFTTDDMDVNFEEVAYSLRKGEISGPVQTAQGYSLIKVTDRVQKPILTEQEFNQHRDRLTGYVRKKKQELRTRNHLQAFLDRHTVNEEVFQSLHEYWFQNREALISGDEEVLRALTANYDNILTDSDFEFSVTEFITEYQASSTKQRQLIQDEASFRDFIRGTAYRAFMVKEAERLAIHLQKDVRESIEETYLHELENLAVDHLRASIRNTPAELFNEFTATAERYAEPLYINLQRIILDNPTSAEKVRTLALSGVEFDELVREYSINGEERLMNGELGFSSIHDFGVNASKLASLQEGQISEVIPYVANEFHIYKVLGREESKLLTFQEAKEWVDEVLTEKKLKALKAETIQLVKEQHNAFVDLDKLNSLVIRI